jgi:hypothetical protein
MSPVSPVFYPSHSVSNKVLYKDVGIVFGDKVTCVVDTSILNPDVDVKLSHIVAYML